MSRKQVGRFSILGEKYPIYEGMNIIGRDLEATVTIRNLKFSKRHAIISVIDSQHYLTDYNSINGTRLRGAKLEPFLFYKLNHKAIVTMGDAVGTYLIESEIQQSPAKKPEPKLLADDTLDDFSEATQRIIDESVEILSSQNDELFIEPTQEVDEPVFLVPETPAKKSASKTPRTGDITRDVSDSFFVAETEDLNGSMDDKDDKYFMISTQQMMQPAAEETVPGTDEECEEEEFDFLEPVDAADTPDELFIAPTQMLRNDEKNVGGVPHVDSEVFIAPTQVLRNESDFAAAKQPLRSRRDVDLDDSEVFIAPTQILQTDCAAANALDISRTQKVDLAKFFNMFSKENDVFSEATQKLAAGDIEKNITVDDNDETLVTLDDNDEKTSIVDDNEEKTDFVDGNVEKTDIVNENDEKIDTVHENGEKIVIVDCNDEKTDIVDENIGTTDIDDNVDDNDEKSDIVGDNDEKINIVDGNDGKIDIVDDNDEKTNIVNGNNEKTNIVVGNDEKTNIVDGNDEKTDIVDDNVEKTENVDENIERTDTADEKVEKTDGNVEEACNEQNDDTVETIDIADNTFETSGDIENIDIISSSDNESECSEIVVRKKIPKTITETQDAAESDTGSDIEILHKPPKPIPETQEVAREFSRFSFNESQVAAPPMDESMKLYMSPELGAKTTVSEPRTASPEREPETQLELNIPSQTVFVVATTARPENPLVHVLEEKPRFAVKNPELRKQLEEFVETQIVGSDSETDIETDTEDLNESFCNRETQALESPKKKGRKRQVGKETKPKRTETVETERNVIDDGEETKVSKSSEMKLRNRRQGEVAESSGTNIVSDSKPETLESTETEPGGKITRLRGRKRTENESQDSKTESVDLGSSKKKLRSIDAVSETKTIVPDKKATRSRGRKVVDAESELFKKKLRGKDRTGTESESPEAENVRRELRVVLPVLSETESVRNESPKRELRGRCRGNANSSETEAKNRSDTETDCSELPEAEKPVRNRRRKSTSQEPPEDDVFVAPRTPRRRRNSESDNSEPVPKRATRHSIALPTITEADSTRKRRTAPATPCDATKTKPERSPSVRAAGRAQKHRIVFTMLDDANLEATVGRLGGTVVNSSDECTVLVTRKICRSLKFLTAVALGKPIVSAEWITQSGRSHRFLDPWDFVLEDAENEGKFGFSLRDALEVKTKVFEARTFLLASARNAEVLKSVIEVNGGRCLTKAPARVGDDVVVVAYEEDVGKYKKYLKAKGGVVAAEAIFASSLRQRLDLDSHRLA